jgi:hypothetical protein
MVVVVAVVVAVMIGGGRLTGLMVLQLKSGRREGRRIGIVHYVRVQHGGGGGGSGRVIVTVRMEGGVG